MAIGDHSQSSGNGNQMTRVGEVNGRIIAGAILRILAEKGRERTLAKERRHMSKEKFCCLFRMKESRADL